MFFFSLSLYQKLGEISNPLVASKNYPGVMKRDKERCFDVNLKFTLKKEYQDKILSALDPKKILCPPT